MSIKQAQNIWTIAKLAKLKRFTVCHQPCSHYCGWSLNIHQYNQHNIVPGLAPFRFHNNTQNAAVAPRPLTTHPLVWAEQHKHTSVYNLPVPGLPPWHIPSLFCPLTPAISPRSPVGEWGRGCWAHFASTIIHGFLQLTQKRWKSDWMVKQLAAICLKPASMAIQLLYIVSWRVPTKPNGME